METNYELRTMLGNRNIRIIYSFIPSSDTTLHFIKLGTELGTSNTMNRKSHKTIWDHLEYVEIQVRKRPKTRKSRDTHGNREGKGRKLKYCKLRG